MRDIPFPGDDELDFLIRQAEATRTGWKRIHASDLRVIHAKRKELLARLTAETARAEAALARATAAEGLLWSVKRLLEAPNPDGIPYIPWALRTRIDATLRASEVAPTPVDTRVYDALEKVARAAGYERAWIAPSGEPNVILERAHPTAAGMIQVNRLDLLVTPTPSPHATTPPDEASRNDAAQGAPHHYHPTPWTVKQMPRGGNFRIYDAAGATVPGEGTVPVLERICRAVNAATPPYAARGEAKP